MMLRTLIFSYFLCASGVVSECVFAIKFLNAFDIIWYHLISFDSIMYLWSQAGLSYKSHLWLGWWRGRSLWTCFNYVFDQPKMASEKTPIFFLALYEWHGFTLFDYFESWTCFHRIFAVVARGNFADGRADFSNSWQCAIKSPKCPNLKIFVNWSSRLRMWVGRSFQPESVNSFLNGAPWGLPVLL